MIHLFFWRAFDTLNGKFECRVIFSEISVNAVYNKNFLLNILDQYSQFYRWGLGIIAFPLAIKTLIFNKKINRLKRVFKFIRLIETFIFIKVSFVVILISIFLASNLVEERLELHNLILKLLVILSFIVIPVKTLIVPKPQNVEEYLYYLPSLGFEIPLGIINLIFFSFIPYFHAAINIAFFENPFRNLKWSKKT